MNRDTTKKKILSTALSVFMKKGKKHTTLKTIADEAKIEEELLKKYFQSEYDILFELFEEYFVNILKKFEPTHIYDDPNLYFKNIIDACRFIKGDGEFYSLYIEFFSENIQEEDYKNNLIMVFESGAQVFAMQLEHFKKLNLLKEDVDIKATARGIITIIDGMMWHKGVFRIKDDFYERMLIQSLTHIKNGIIKN